MKVFLVILYFLKCIIIIFALGPTAGPVGKIITNSVRECDEKNQTDELFLYLDVKSIDNKGSKALFLNITNKIPIDDSMEMDIDTQKWESSGWKKFHHYKGSLCNDVFKYGSKLYNKIAAATTPNLPASCPIKPGTYILTKFQATTKDLDVPTIFYGRFLNKVIIFKDGKIMSCRLVEGDSQAAL